MFIKTPVYNETDDTLEILKYKGSIKRWFVGLNVITFAAIFGELFFALFVGFGAIPLIVVIVMEYIYFLSVCRNGQPSAMRVYTYFQVACTVMFAYRVITSFLLFEGIILALYAFRAFITFFIFKYYSLYLEKVSLVTKNAQQQSTLPQESFLSKLRSQYNSTKQTLQTAQKVSAVVNSTSALFETSKKPPQNDLPTTYLGRENKTNKYGFNFDDIFKDQPKVPKHDQAASSIKNGKDEFIEIDI
uniref:Receptor expression-enhancing protein n=1 Tax=Rhabditophanes sp. KR3021 TaxID=114890 RepID=A0AC35TZH3_9BILA